MHLWLPAPRQFPAQCFITGLSGREHGPYLEIDLPPGRPYIEPRSRREGRMYWSFASWRTTVTHPDSPYKAILDAEVEKRTQELQDEITNLKAQIARDPVMAAFERFHKTVDANTVEQRAVTVPSTPEDVPETPQARHNRPRRPNR